MNTPNSITRREALSRLSFGALLACGLWPGALRADNERGGRKFRFIVINDTHCLSPECVPYLRGVVAEMKKLRPAFCLHAGDLTNEAQLHYMEAVRDTFGKLGVPTYTVPGNHDYVSNTDRRTYDATFPNLLNYYFTWNGWQFIALDTTDGQRYRDTRIQPATLAWLDDHLPCLNPRQPTVAFTHFPLGEGVPMRPLNADDLLTRFRDFNLQAVYCGHHHGLTEHRFQQADVTTNRCCALKRANHDGTKEKGFFLCTAGAGRVQRQFVEHQPA